MAVERKCTECPQTIADAVTIRLRYPIAADNTRNSSGDEIANVNFLYDDIVYTYYKIQ